MFNVTNEHQLIERTQNYRLDKKILTIHSEDRDTTKYPNSNSFSIQCPEKYTNIQSIRLANAAFPSTQYVFSEEYKNTKMNFKLRADNLDQSYYYILSGDVIGANYVYTYNIPPGYYTPTQLAFELENGLNNLITSTINKYNTDITTYTYSCFKVFYNTVENRLYFGNTDDTFTILASNEILYDVNCNQMNIFSRKSKWGLPYYLGFEKTIYSSTPLSDGETITFNYLPSNSNYYSWLGPKTSDNYKTPSYIIAPNQLDILGENCIYMEIDKLNNIDEIVPYTLSTGDIYYNNDYNGLVNGSFAKIPITTTPTNYFFDGSNYFNTNVVYFTNPLEQISKLSFRFRYHDGRLVDFKNLSFNFSLEFYLLTNEIKRDMNVSMPSYY